MVKFLEDEQRLRCWYVQADYVIDHRDTVWVAHFEQSCIRDSNAETPILISIERVSMLRREASKIRITHLENKANNTHQTPSAELASRKHQQSRLPNA